MGPSNPGESLIKRWDESEPSEKRHSLEPNIFYLERTSHGSGGYHEHRYAAERSRSFRIGLAVAIQTNSYDVPEHSPARDGRDEHLPSCFRDTPHSLTCNGFG